MVVAVAFELDPAAIVQHDKLPFFWIVANGAFPRVVLDLRPRRVWVECVAPDDLRAVMQAQPYSPSARVEFALRFAEAKVECRVSMLARKQWDLDSPLATHRDNNDRSAVLSLGSACITSVCCWSAFE